MRIIDMHCDTLSGALIRYGKDADLMRMPEMMVDLERMKKGDYLGQFFAIFMIPKEQRVENFRKGLATQQHAGLIRKMTAKEETLYLESILDDEVYISYCRHIYDENLKQHGDFIAQSLNAEDIRKNQKAGKISGILTMEGGEAIDGRIENLERFYQMGIRVLNLTWNYANCFGTANSWNKAEMEKGLTSFGKEAVVYMQERGMLVDVSHLSDGGFWDVVDICKKPFIASHSNCRALSPHPRNLTDEMIRSLAEHGGVTGINFYPCFLNEDQMDMKSRVERMVAMVKHMKQVGGIEVIGIGSDFDGITGELEIAGCEQMHCLTEALIKAGLTSSELDKIMGGNTLRVLQDTL